MKTTLKSLLTALLLACVPQVGGAQEASPYGVPTDVYFLMPAFGEGMIWFSDQPPAQGMLNICAEDNTLRFLDEKGQELVASSLDNVLKVKIDSAIFVRQDELFYRVYSISLGVGVGVRRDLMVQRGAQKAAFGGYSKTSSTRGQSTYYADGVGHKLETPASLPYKSFETYFLYTGTRLVPFNKKNLRKAFPERKDDIDAFLKAGNALPDSLPAIRAFVTRLASGEAL